MNRVWHYNGPIWHFEQLIQNQYNKYTTAVSKEKAASNIKYVYKIEHGFKPNYNVKLDMHFLKEEILS